MALRLPQECYLTSTVNGLLGAARQFLLVRSKEVVVAEGGHDVYSRSESNGLAGCASEICALRGDPPSIDCWLWISGSRPCEMAQGTRRIRCDPSCHRRSLSAIDGLAHNQH